VKQLLKHGVISLQYARFEKNLEDPLTKGLTKVSGAWNVEEDAT